LGTCRKMVQEMLTGNQKYISNPRLLKFKTSVSTPEVCGVVQ